MMKKSGWEGGEGSVWYTSTAREDPPDGESLIRFGLALGQQVDRELATDIGRHFYSWYDGYEVDWPRTFYVYSDEAGLELVGRFEVDVEESEPSFLATELRC